MAAESAPATLREETDDEDTAVALAAIPAVDEAAPSSGTRRSKRARSNTHADAGAGHVLADQSNQVEVISDEDDAGEDDHGLFVRSPPRESPPAKRRRPAPAAADGEDDDDKKKLAMDISYEGFSIYGRVLCLVVKRRDGGGADRAERDVNNVPTPAAGSSGNKRAKAASRGRGQAMMEDFILSTQIPAGTDVP